MNQNKMSQRMNNIARTSSDKFKAVVAPIKMVTNTVLDKVVGPVERRMQKMDETRSARNSQMIQDNYPGGMAGYEKAVQKKNATKASIKALKAKSK